jgi:outer membrane protein assembly factor BamB
MNLRKNKFSTKNKTVTTIALILLLIFSIQTLSISCANAAVPTKTYGFIAANPNPIGVGQTLQVSMWLADPPPTAAGAGGDRWIGFTVTITRPDGQVETKGPYNSDAVGGAYFQYNPTMTGVYTFQMHYPGGQTMAGWSFFTGAFDNTYLASDSNVYSVTVQQDPIVDPQGTPPPTGYWTRPIYGENHRWAQSGSNWLMPAWNSMSRSFDAGFAIQPEGTAPNTAHVLWTKEMCFGGLVGGVYGTAFFHDGRSYEYFFKPPVIISGRLYYNDIYGNEGAVYGSGTAQPTGWNSFSCVDMETGETLFTIPNEFISFGQIYNYASPNQAGAFAYLWSTTGTNYKMYDAWSGKWILTIANVTGGVQTFSDDGSLINYNIADGKITCWNSSKAIGPLASTGSEAWQWRPYTFAGQTLDGNKGIEWSVPASNDPGESIAPLFGQAAMLDDQGNILSMANGVDFYAYSMTDGSFKYKSTLQPPTDIPAKESLTGIAAFLNTYEFSGTYYSFVKATLQWVAYDVRTGQVKWKTEPYSNPWSMYGTSVVVAYGKFYAGGYGGDLNCYNDATGELLWTYPTGSAGFQTPYGFWPIYSGLTVADGKIIFTTSEHGNGVETLYTGEKIYVINAETGGEVWKINGWFEQCAIADGKMVTHNCYDNQLYCFGKGPSQTTVSAPLTAVPKGTAMMITGTVTDQSPAQKGTPCVSDIDQPAWMAYLQMQQSMPMATGVPVTLTAIAADGSSTPIGAVTSDGNGMFKKSWTPTNEGEYTIVASFGGTQSYGDSYAETAVVVTAAAASTQTTTTGTSTDTYIIVATIVLLIAIILAVVVLRKK